MPPPTPGPVPTKKTNWWLIGCGGCLGLIVLGLIGGAVLVFGVTRVIKSTEPYTTAVSAAMNSPAVQARLGTPIQPGFLPQGNVNSHTSNGVTTETADLTIPLKGPKASGHVHYAASREGAKWEVRDFTVTVDGTGEQIKLGQ